MKGARGGGIRIFVGSRHPQMTSPSITSFRRSDPFSPQIYGYSYEFVEKDPTEIRSWRDIKSKYTGWTLWSELKSGKLISCSQCSLSSHDYIMILDINNQASNICPKNLGNDVSVNSLTRDDSEVLSYRKALSRGNLLNIVNAILTQGLK